MECKQATNLENCPCTSEKCSRKGFCCDCLSSHLAKQSLPACCFPPGNAKEFGRSFEGFARAWGVIK